jgi:hypothetical protein
MLPFVAVTATKPAETNMWTASAYAGVITAVAAVITGLLFQTEILVLWILAFLLIGAGPVLGYQLATRRLGSEWGALVCGVLGFILLPLGFILWPILVGALSREQSILKLLAASLIGFILGAVVFGILGAVMGQDPSWVGFGFTMLWAVWGGTVGAAMVAWADYPRL